MLAGVVQFVALAAAIVVVLVLINNVRVSSANQDIAFNLDFLDQPASFEIPGNDFRVTQPVRQAIVQGVLNTLRITVAGIFLATVLGTLIGIGRLSRNWLLSTVCRVYVEVIRNLPLLGILYFAYLVVVLNSMPRVENSVTIPALLVANVRGVAVPWITGSMIAFLIVLVVAALVAVGVARWRQSVAARTGEPPRDLLWSIPVFLIVAFWGAVLAGNGITTPALEGRAVEGGILMQPEYFALLAGLVAYTASHIAEIVRGSIQAVPSGQFEASSALALGTVDRMRYVILPQAMRVAIPPLGNQYLNLMKNSSLGAVVSYFDLTKVTQATVGNGNPAVPAYLLTLLIYLVLSLVISLLVNLANRHFQVVDR